MFGVHGAYRPHRGQGAKRSKSDETGSASLLQGNGFSDLQPQPLTLPAGFGDSLLADQVLSNYRSVLTPDSSGSGSSGDFDSTTVDGVGSICSTPSLKQRSQSGDLAELMRRISSEQAPAEPSQQQHAPSGQGLPFPLDLDALASRLGANGTAGFSGRQVPAGPGNAEAGSVTQKSTNNSSPKGALAEAQVSAAKHRVESSVPNDPLALYRLLLFEGGGGGSQASHLPGLGHSGASLLSPGRQQPGQGLISSVLEVRSPRGAQGLDGLTPSSCESAVLRGPALEQQRLPAQAAPPLARVDERAELGSVEMFPAELDTPPLELNYFAQDLELLEDDDFLGGNVPSRPNYTDVHAAFCLEDMEGMLSGSLLRGINVCYECADRHCGQEAVALYWEDQEGRSSRHTFEELRDKAARFANFLREQGVQPGDRVACLLPRIPELLVVALGTLRLGAVYLPLFTAFGPKALQYRLERSNARLVVTNSENRRKLDSLLRCPPVMVVGEGGHAEDMVFQQELERQLPEFKPVARCGSDPFLLMFTSGTVGQPKGVYVPIKALLSFIAYMRYGVDLQPSDCYWNASDPGWAFGLFYGMVAPLLLGNSTIFYDGRFTPESTFHILSKYKVTNLAAAPTLYRLLMAAGPELPQKFSTCLRVAQSAGEPLNPEVIRWFGEHLNAPVHDQYGQTEVGMVCANHHALDHAVHWGSMGLPVPGFHLVALDDQLQEVKAGEMGQLAIDKAKSPLFCFNGYMDQMEPDTCPYYLTGDKVEVSEDGRFTFMGRSDDIINSAGYRIGPFDVEHTLLEHPAVAESAVIGKPDAERGELVKAFIKLSVNYVASAELAGELQRLVKRRLSSHSYPREVAFVVDLPKTPSGKIQRYILRQQELEQIDSYQE